MNDPLIQEFAQQFPDNLSQSVAAAFETNLNNDEETQIAAIKNVFDSVFTERVNAISQN